MPEAAIPAPPIPPFAPPLVIPAKAGIPLFLAASALQRSAKRAHYSLDSRLRGNGG